MQKEAQKKSTLSRLRGKGRRSLLDRLRESTNVGGIAAEHFFDPKFKAIMDQLRDEVDEPVRAIVTGDYEQLGEFSLRELLNSAKSNLNRREYMKCVADLGRFHRNVAEIVKKLESFRANVDEVHKQFLLSGLVPDSEMPGEYDEEYAGHLEEMKKRFVPPAKEANIQYNLTKEAGISDFLANIGTRRGRALAAWEKRYPTKVKELKKQTEILLNKSETLFKRLVGMLEVMAKSRATRKVDDYIEQSKKIINDYNIYNTSFMKYYDSQVRGFLEAQELLAPTKPAEKPAELGGQDVGEPKREPELIQREPVANIVPMTSAPKLPLIEPMSQEEYKESVPTQAIPKPPLVPQVEVPEEEYESDRVAREILRDTNPTVFKEESTVPPAIKVEKSPAISLSQDPGFKELNKPSVSPVAKLVQELPKKEELKPKVPAGNIYVKPKESKYNKFIDSLEKMSSNESPAVLASYILKYAKLIEKSDPETTNKLVAIVKLIKA